MLLIRRCLYSLLNVNLQLAKLRLCLRWMSLKPRTMKKPTERLVSTNQRMKKQLIIEKLKGCVMAVCLVHQVNIISNASLFANVLEVSKEFNFTVRTLKPGHLEEDCPVTKFSFSKQKIFKFFCKWTNVIHKFEVCFLSGQVSLNSFEVFNSCIVEP